MSTFFQGHELENTVELKFSELSSQFLIPVTQKNVPIVVSVKILTCDWPSRDSRSQGLGSS